MTPPHPEREAGQYRARVAEQPGGLIVAQVHASTVEAVEAAGQHYLAMYGPGHALSVERKVIKRWKLMHFYAYLVRAHLANQGDAG